MAVATFSTDLVTINTADGTDGNNASGGWSETSGHTVGAAPIFDGDVVIQGTTSVSKQTGSQATGVEAGFNFNFGTNIRNDANWTDGTSVVFFWWNQLYPAALESFGYLGVPSGESVQVQGGFLLGIGSGEANQKYFNVGGNDVQAGPYGGWINSAIDPTGTADYTDGSPGTAYSVFSCLPNLAQSIRRGQTMAMDVIRWGPRGQITVGGGTSPDPAGTFEKLAEFNDKNATGAVSGFTLIDSGFHRLGIFQEISGGYLWKGRLLITGTFTDSNRNILTEEAQVQPYAGFTELAVTGTMTLSAVQFNNAGTLSGQSNAYFDFLSGDVTLNSCSFTKQRKITCADSSHTTQMTSCTITNVREIDYRNNGNFDNCTFTVAISEHVDFFSTDRDAINKIENCTFTADGTPSNDYIFNYTGANFADTFQIDWSSTLDGWTAGSAGNNVATSDGDEAIRIGSTTGTVNIVVADGATIPKVASAGATINISIGQKTLTVKVIDAITKNPIQGARVYITADTGGPLSQGTVIINKTLTDANGETSDTRSYASDQPITGVIRLASTAPFYKTSEVTATVSSTADTSLTVSMISDE